MTLTMMDWFCGAGGSSQGAAAVPGVSLTLAANHWDVALKSHASNFPGADHYQGDIRDAPVHNWPIADLFWASPECPQWSNARGKPRDFDAASQPTLWDDLDDDEREAKIEAERSRALMEEVPMYLAGVQRRGGLVLAGVVENVVDVRAWRDWDRWVAEFRTLGYRTKTIALNSMHAQNTRTPRAPQSRDRLYFAYWHESLGRDPDWDRWLRPRAYCPTCDESVNAVQVFKRPDRDMGRYRQSYVYRCPRVSCRNTVIEPDVLPAASAIDWTLPAERIGDRVKPLAAATMARIRAGMTRYWEPLLVPAGGTWRDSATPLADPMPTRTTRESDGLALPAMLVPVEGRTGKIAAPASAPLRTQTARNETGLAFAPFVIPMRGGGDKERARPITAPLHTVSAGGNHHGLVEVPSLLVPYNGKGAAAPATAPVGTLPTHDRFGLAAPALDIDDVRFRMLAPAEIGRAMAFTAGYIVTGNKRQQVRQYGNAVTPPVSEVLVSALVEAITGNDLELAA